MTQPPPVGLDELTAALTRLARTPGSKQLLCAPDVADTLAARLPAAGPPEPPWSAFHDAGIIARLLAVDIIPTPDSPAGTFRLVRHYDPDARAATCEVHGETVSHGRCAVVLEGTLAA
jgi:hypothetical protein